MTKQVRLTNKTKQLMGITSSTKAKDLNGDELFKEVIRVYTVYSNSMKDLFSEIDKNDFLSEIQSAAVASGVSEMAQDYKKWWNMIVEARNFYNETVTKSTNTAIEELDKKQNT